MRTNKKYINKRLLYTGFVILLAVLTWILTLLSIDNPDKVERIYSTGLYPILAKGVGKITGWIPFAVGEILIFILIFIVIMALLFAIIKPNIVFKNLGRLVHIVIRVVGMAYVLFYFIWGFNYYRQDYTSIAGMDEEISSIQDLEDLTLYTIAKANKVRATLDEDEEGVFLIKDDFKDLAVKAKEGFEDYYVGDKYLGGNYGTAKPLKISKWMSYTGITGIYLPYTSEANVNIDIPHTNIPATTCHEMAHQRGFAREDEANFIAYIASINNPHPEFEYSGHYLALQYLLSDIRKRDLGIYDKVIMEISDPIRRDMNNEYYYWKGKESKAEEVVTTMNDNYLKANNQGAGVQSYNGVVKLLLRHYQAGLY